MHFGLKSLRQAESKLSRSLFVLSDLGIVGRDSSMPYTTMFMLLSTVFVSGVLFESFIIGGCCVTVA